MRLAVKLFTLGMLVSPIAAEKVNMTPGRLKGTATHVIIAEVRHIYERMEVDQDWKTIRYLAEVRVNEVEKGEGVKKNDLIYIRYWRRSPVVAGKHLFSTLGHRDLPNAGESLRIYMARDAYDGFGTTNDGGFNVIGANGFERLRE
jgi:hypothetical protein